MQVQGHTQQSPLVLLLSFLASKRCELLETTQNAGTRDFKIGIESKPLAHNTLLTTLASISNDEKCQIQYCGLLRMIDNKPHQKRGVGANSALRLSGPSDLDRVLLALTININSFIRHYYFVLPAQPLLINNHIYVPPT